MENTEPDRSRNKRSERGSHWRWFPYKTHPSAGSRRLVVKMALCFEYLSSLFGGECSNVPFVPLERPGGMIGPLLPILRVFLCTFGVGGFILLWKRWGVHVLLWEEPWSPIWLVCFFFFSFSRFLLLSFQLCYFSSTRTWSWGFVNPLVWSENRTRKDVINFEGRDGALQVPSYFLQSRSWIRGVI